jgi:hypothetical protein
MKKKQEKMKKKKKKMKKKKKLKRNSAVLYHDPSKKVFFTVLNVEFLILTKPDKGLLWAETRSGCLRIKM